MPMSPRIKAKKGRFGSSGLAPVVAMDDPVVTEIPGTGSPVGPSTFTIDLAGTADDGGVDISASLVWVSSIDGALGTGATLTGVAVSAGTHIITATAEDATGSPVRSTTLESTVIVG